MKTKTETPQVARETDPPRAIKIVGVGGAGVSLLDALNNEEFGGASFVAINTDAPSLAASSASLKIHLETTYYADSVRAAIPNADARSRSAAIMFPTIWVMV